MLKNNNNSILIKIALKFKNIKKSFNISFNNIIV